MIDIEIRFKPYQKDRDLGSEFPELPEKLRRNVYFFAHICSMLDQDLEIFDIREKEGKKSLIVFPSERQKDKSYDRMKIPRAMHAINALMQRPRSNPMFVYNPYSSPCTFEVFI